MKTARNIDTEGLRIILGKFIWNGWGKTEGLPLKKLNNVFVAEREYKAGEDL